jgi:hypothetical protein
MRRWGRVGFCMLLTQSGSSLLSHHDSIHAPLLPSTRSRLPRIMTKGWWYYDLHLKDNVREQRPAAFQLYIVVYLNIYRDGLASFRCV